MIFLLCLLKAVSCIYFVPQYQTSLTNVYSLIGTTTNTITFTVLEIFDYQYMFWVLLAQYSLCIQLVPKYCSDQIQINFKYQSFLVDSDQTIYSPITYPTLFTAIPQVLISLEYVYVPGGITSYSTKTTSIREDGFILLTTSTNPYSYFIRIRWIAFLDDNIIAQVGSIVQNIVSERIYADIVFSKPQAQLPNAAVFLTGVNQTKSDIYSGCQYSVLINSISLTSIQLVVNIEAEFAVSQIDFNFIYGSPQYLSAGQAEFSPVTNFYHIDLNPSTKVVQIGFNGLYGRGTIYIGIWGSENIYFNNYVTWPIIRITMNYFCYMPCPLYCTTCNGAVPSCDSCLISTKRIGFDCTTCQSQTYAVADQINCQSCQSYCDQCSGNAANCLICLASTQRQAPPMCSTCPSQMFIESGVDNCQKCASYCNECLGVSTTCSICLASTQRTDPPNCAKCPSQMFLQSGVDNCLQCASYCDRCLGVSANCFKCQVSTQRTDPPSCTKCPSQMYLESGVDDCQCKYKNYQECASYCNQCVDTSITCSSCLSSTLRTTPPSCTTCPPSMFVQVNIDNCQYCSLICNQCTESATNCIQCNVSTLRVNPPNCQQCLPLMYIKNGILNCQQCGTFCGSCIESANNCTFCLEGTFRINPPSCTICQSQYYSIINSTTCQPCTNFCNECSQEAYNCSACSDVSMRMNPPSCTTCPPQYHVVQNLYNCQRCLPYCNNCLNFTYSRIACDATSLRLNPPACIDCPQQYYTSGNTCTKCGQTCQTCNSSTCLTCISKEYRVQNLTCQFCPQKCVACDPQGNCYMEPQNCQLGIYINRGFIQCTICQSNYYLDHDFCKQCSPKCLECNKQPQFCTICRFPSLAQIDCQLCESQPGIYSNYDTNTCYSICGDGIISLNEQCDDGNLSSQDGCTNCQIDPGYFCEGIVCQAIIYPIPFIIQNTTLDTIFNAEKAFLLSYNVPINKKVLDLELKISNFTSYTYNTKQINGQLYSISIILSEQLVNSQLEVRFINTNDIISDQGFQQQISSIQCSISDYLKQTNSEQDMSDSTNTVMTYLFIVLAIIILSAVLFGGLEMFWNLLDLFQTMSYLKYVNTAKPYYLYQFLNFFGFLQIQNLPQNQLFNIQDYIDNLTDISQFKASPQLISNDGFTTSTIINIIPILDVIFTGICIYSFAVMTIILLEQFKCVLNPNAVLRNIKVMKYIYKLKCFLIYTSRSIITQFFWSGLIRIFISSAYDICFAISLGVYGLKFQNSSYLSKLDSAMTMLLAFCYFFITWLIIIVANFNSKTLRQTIQKYGSVYEGLKLSKQLMKQNTALILMKKMLFMIFLVLLYNEPIFQILNIVAIQISQLLFLIIIDPLADKTEKQKQILCEFFMLVAEIKFAVLVIDDYWTLFIYEKRRIVGWICFIALVIIVLSHIAIDTHRQVQFYYKHYPSLRRCWQSIKSKFRGQPVKQVSIQDMII